MNQPGGKDLYAILGVARNADSEAIKKSYRRLAREFHPDRNKGDARAEERFKEVSAAYTVLSDDKRRRDYDEFGEAAIDPNFDGEKVRGASRGFGGGFRQGDFSQSFSGGGGFQDAGGFSDLFGDLFGAGGGQNPRRAPRKEKGADLETTLQLDFEEAVRGCEKRVDLDRPTGDGQTRRETLSIRIPPGVEENGRIRLAGKGAPGAHGGPAGDLMARIRIRPHRFFKRASRDLSLEAPISVLEAIQGAEIEIPTLDDPVTLRVPPGSDSGTRLRLRGKGVPKSANKPTGDLYVTLRIKVPGVLSPEQTKRLKEILPDDAAHWRREEFS